MDETKLRMNLNSSALVKSISLLSNTVLLTANAYLVGSRFSNFFREQKREKIVSNLQMLAELASAGAGLTKIISETLERRHERD